MKQIIVKSGKTFLADVPCPITLPGTVLAKVSYSCISQGTEISGIQTSGKSKTEKIVSIMKDKPQAIQKAIDLYKEEGFSSVYSKYKSATKLDVTSKPTGYSISGVVEEVGDGITDMKKGDRVACAGAGIANHAEYVVVPRNLIMKVPDELDLKLASTVTLGGIAMQGVRRGNFKLGEFAAVIGLGFLGQLTVQMLNSCGCRVIAMDIDDRRCQIAKEQGAEVVINSKNYYKIEENIIKITNGYGVDEVILFLQLINILMLTKKICIWMIVAFVPSYSMMEVLLETSI